MPGWRPAGSFCSCVHPAHSSLFDEGPCPAESEVCRLAALMKLAGAGGLERWGHGEAPVGMLGQEGSQGQGGATGV